MAGSVRNYAILYVRGTRTGGTVVGGGNAVLSTDQHALDGAEHTGASDSTRLDATTSAHGLLPKLSGDANQALLGDGTWGALVSGLLAAGGERHGYTTIIAGSAETLDLSAANWFIVTLTEACTFTFTNPPGSGVGGEWTIVLRGEFSVTWPASVVWRDTDGSETAAAPPIDGGLNVVVVTTLDGGTSYAAALDNGSELYRAAVTDGFDSFVWEGDELVWEWSR